MQTIYKTASLGISELSGRTDHMLNIKDPAKRAEWVYGQPMTPCPKCGSYDMKPQIPIALGTAGTETMPQLVAKWARGTKARASPGAWGKGATTHETVSRAEGREPYKIAEFRHANDAQFCDLAHVFVPRLLSEIEAMQSRVQEVEAANTEVEKLKAEVKKLQQQLIAEAKKTAEEKLRADKLDKQHTMQSRMHAEANQKLVEAARQNLKENL